MYIGKLLKSLLYCGIFYTMQVQSYAFLTPMAWKKDIISRFYTVPIISIIQNSSSYTFIHDIFSTIYSLYIFEQYKFTHFYTVYTLILYILLTIYVLLYSVVTK